MRCLMMASSSEQTINRVVVCLMQLASAMRWQEDAALILLWLISLAVTNARMTSVGDTGVPLGLLKSRTALMITLKQVGGGAFLKLVPWKMVKRRGRPWFNMSLANEAGVGYNLRHPLMVQEVPWMWAGLVVLETTWVLKAWTTVSPLRQPAATTWEVGVSMSSGIGALKGQTFAATRLGAGCLVVSAKLWASCGFGFGLLVLLTRGAKWAPQGSLWSPPRLAGGWCNGCHKGHDSAHHSELLAYN